MNDINEEIDIKDALAAFVQDENFDDDFDNASLEGNNDYCFQEQDNEGKSAYEDEEDLDELLASIDIDSLSNSQPVKVSVSLVIVLLE